MHNGYAFPTLSLCVRTMWSKYFFGNITKGLLHHKFHNVISLWFFHLTFCVRGHIIVTSWDGNPFRIIGPLWWKLSITFAFRHKKVVMRNVFPCYDVIMRERYSRATKHDFNTFCMQSIYAGKLYSMVCATYCSDQNIYNSKALHYWLEIHR